MNVTYGDRRYSTASTTIIGRGLGLVTPRWGVTAKIFLGPKYFKRRGPNFKMYLCLLV